MINAQLLIDLLRGKKKITFVDNKKYKYKQTQNSYNHIIKQLRQKVRNNQMIKVYFSVIYDSCFQSAPIFEKMINDDIFEPFILVIPDAARGEENMFYQMNKTYDTLSKKYGEEYVIRSWNDETKEFIDYSNQIDIIFFNNLYDDMTHEYYKITYNSTQGCLTCYTGYGYTISNWGYSLNNHKEYLNLWRIFSLEKYEYDNFKMNFIKGSNAQLTGYCKMDKIIDITRKINQNKTIILAPHHTITNWKNGLNLSTFMQYYDFFLELPKMFPNINFIFRPHPLLFVNLRKENIWGEVKTNEYLDKIDKIPNMIYQNGGDYLETFVNSDALIHDCGSFSVEYLFTEHPCCYLLKDEETTNKNSNEFHKACIKQHYQAYSKKDIIDFINNIVINEKDFMKEQREKFFNENVKINFPHTTNNIMNYLKKEFGLND